MTLTAMLAALCAAPAAFALDTGDIVITSIKGEVHVIMSGTEREVRAGAVLELPASVRTGADGALELKQGATTVGVGPDTQLDFPALEKRGGSIDRIVQPRGNAFYSIGKRPGHRLRIETPYLVGVVKGTQFNVVAQENTTTISLFEGLLEVRSSDDSDVIDLHAGEIASRSRTDTDISVLKMGGDKPPAPPRAPADAQKSGDAAPAPAPARPGSTPGDAADAGSLFVVRDSSELRPLAIAPAPVDVAADQPAAANVAAPATGVDPLPAVTAAPSTPPLSGVSVAVPPSVDMNATVNVTPGSGAAEVAVAASPVVPLPVSVPVSLDVNSSVGNVDLGVSAGAGGVTNLLSDDNGGQGSGGNSGPGNNGNSGQGNNGNSGQGNNGNGQGNDGVGPGNNGQGNNDSGNVVDDVQNLLDSLRGKSGKKK